MKEDTTTSRAENGDGKHDTEVGAGGDKPEWISPTLEEVSGQVMAQPYIRFT